MQVVVDETLIEEVLGPQPFSVNDAVQRVAGAGSAAGLVWTSAGGQVRLLNPQIKLSMLLTQPG